MRTVLSLLLVMGFTLAMTGCGESKSGASVPPTGLLPTPKEGPKPAVGGAPPPQAD